MTIGEYVKKVREDKDITQRGLALKAGVSNSTISNLESGMRIPGVEILEAIARALNVDFIELMKYHQNKAPEPTYRIEDMFPVEMVQLPLVGTVRAGKPILAVENIERYIPVASMFLSRTKEYFVLRITGDSMDREFKEGTLVVIEKTNEIEDGNIAVVGINGSEATIKKVQFTDDGVVLYPMSNNPIHQPKFYHIEKDEVHILGKLRVSMNEY